MMPLFSQAPVSVPTWFACSVSALESWKFNPESQRATESHPPPAPINCVLGEVEEMLSIRTSGNPTPKQCSLSQKPQTSANSSLQAHYPFRQDSLEKKKTETTHNQHAEFHMDTNKAAEDIVTLACV